MNKSLNFTASVLLTILLLITGAVVASTMDQAPQNAATSTSSKQPQLDEAAIETASLSVELQGVRSTTGKLLIMVFDEKHSFKNYDYNKAVGYQELDAKVGNVVVDFPTLTQGTYAVFAMHDENGDYDLNEQDGYPVEGFVISGAKSRYDEPTFKQASITAGHHKLEMVYF